MNKIKSLVLNVVYFFFRSKATFAVFIALVLAPVGLLYTSISNTQHPKSFTVKVTNLKGNSGGSGSIIATGTYKSIVLTNAHVCDVLNKDGGYVQKEDGSRYMAVGYFKSQFHDLCALWVAADLGASIKLATKAPEMYSEATITGHPNLLPNVINKGNFGNRETIQIMTSVRPCSKEEASSDFGIICFLLGGVPIITTYESITVSATIMGGSSGSAVLNDSGELSGVVFAGRGSGLSYAFIVPFEFVASFIKEELPQAVLTKVPLPKTLEQEVLSLFKAKAKLKAECQKPSSRLERYCQVVDKDLL